MENVFEPMDFDGEVFEPMNFDGSSSDSIYFDGNEYSNFLPFTILKKNATPSKPILGKVLKSIVRKEPSVRINATVVPPKKQSIITDVNKKPFVVTPLDSQLKPIGRPYFPIKNIDVVISEPISKKDIKPMNIKEISAVVSKNIGLVVEKPSILTPSQISVVTETIVKDNNNKPFLITPINSVKSDEFKQEPTKSNVVISINDKDLPKPIDAKNEEGKNIEVASAIKEDIIKSKEDVVPSTNLQTTPSDVTTKKSNKTLYVGLGVLALVGVLAYFTIKKNK